MLGCQATVAGRGLSFPSRCSAVTAPLQIHGLTRAAFVAAAKERLSRGAGVAPRLYRQVLQAGRFAPETFGLSAEAVAGWRRCFRHDLPEVSRLVTEEDERGWETAKAVLRLPDGLEYETVLIPMGRGRHTLCISSQVGCKMGCAFCETGRMGLLRDLPPQDVVAQLLVARHRLGWRFRNVVFMGMGEALDDVDKLVRVLDILGDSSAFGLAQERITVCTVGRVDGIRRLSELGYKRLNLSVSLNAANDALRDELMPVNRVAPLAELQQALSLYRPRRNFALGVNYCLLPGLNDGREDARDIARFCAPLGRVMVSLIPFNPGTSPLTRAPTEEEVVRFVGWLREEGLPVRRRIPKGREVMAACGQLGNRQLAEAKRTLPVRTG